MKIWCVDHAGLGWDVGSDLYFTKMEAEEKYNQYASINGAYVKLYQVEDIWGWCARNFTKVIDEIITSRDNGDNFTYIRGMANEIREAAVHCGIEQFSVDAFWTESDDFILSVAWVYEGKLLHHTFYLDGLDCEYNYSTIVERRSKWQNITKEKD